MPDEFSRDTVYIISKSARRYEVLKTQNGVIFKKRSTPAVLPDYVKPRPRPVHKVITPPEDKVVSIINRPTPIVNVKAKEQPDKVEQPVNAAPISNSTSFAELQKKVSEMRKQEEERKAKEKPAEVIAETEEVPIVTIEDADDLAEGKIAEEQELINKEYLKSLQFHVLKKVYFVATGKKVDKSVSKFEMRKEILAKYREANANRKKVIYESSRG